jgi:hypothetical protein
MVVSVRLLSCHEDLICVRVPCQKGGLHARAGAPAFADLQGQRQQRRDRNGDGNCGGGACKTRKLVGKTQSKNNTNRPRPFSSSDSARGPIGLILE